MWLVISNVEFWHIPVDELVVFTSVFTSVKTSWGVAIAFSPDPEDSEWSTKTLDTWSFTRFIKPDHSALITGWDEERIFGSSLTHDGQWGLMVELDENIQTLFQSFSFNLLNRSWTIQIQVMFMSNRWLNWFLKYQQSLGSVTINIRTGNSASLQRFKYCSIWCVAVLSVQTDLKLNTR